ncbi:MAG: metallophosphoesterase [Methanosarcinales archaeon]|nr:metallophosphoesterase [Methanosarcinales archaeon]
MEIAPLVGRPALLAEGKKRVLAVADLHLGIEYELFLCGASIPSQTGKLLSSLLELVKASSPDLLVIVGDLKHNVPRTSWQERTEVPRFVEALSELAEVRVVPGNHDGGLADLLPEAKLAPATGLVLDQVGYFHGHTRPSPEVLRCRRLVAGHVHPTVRLADPLGHGHSQRVWARAPLLPEETGEGAGAGADAGRESAEREIIMMPAFNPLCGGLPLNADIQEERGPLPRMARLRLARIYLLDGTFLGSLEHIRASKPGRAGR